MQQINLLSDDLRPQRHHVSGMQVLMGWGGFVVILGLISAWQMYDLSSLQQQSQTRSREVQQLRDQLAAVQAEVEGPDDLRGQLEQLQDEYASQTRLAQRLRDAPGASGFGNDLRSLAEAGVSGLWLTGIKVARDVSAGSGTHLSLHGRAQEAVLVPRLLQNLSRQLHFKGQRFGSIELDGQSDDPTIGFRIVGRLNGAAG